VSTSDVTAATTATAPSSEEQRLSIEMDRWSHLDTEPAMMR
jgi:hypothetical protein